MKISAHDHNVQAIYVYDPSINADSESGEAMPPDATMHLVVRVTSSSAALDAFVGALDRALTSNLKDLPSPQFASRKAVLDVTLVTDEDVRRGSSLAGLLSGVFARPIQVWQHA